jgi:hypothetical protein
MHGSRAFVSGGTGHRHRSINALLQVRCFRIISVHEASPHLAGSAKLPPSRLVDPGSLESENT